MFCPAMLCVSTVTQLLKLCVLHVLYFYHLLSAASLQFPVNAWCGVSYLEFFFFLQLLP